MPYLLTAKEESMLTSKKHYGNTTNINVQSIKEKFMRAIKWCNECHKKAVLTHHNTGWCATVAMMGGMNHFGYCIKKGIDSPELKEFDKRFKGEK